MKQWHIWLGMVAVLTLVSITSYWVYDNVGGGLFEIGLFINAFLISAFIYTIGATVASIEGKNSMKSTIWGGVICAAISAIFLFQMIIQLR